MCLGGLFVSLSRGGLLALGFSMLAALFLSGRYRPLAMDRRDHGGPCDGRLLRGPCAAPGARPRHQGRRRYRADRHLARRMAHGRGAPVRGIGSGNFPQASIHYFLAPGALRYGQYFIDHPKVAHNMYLHVLAELGIVGLALFLSLIGFSILATIKAAQRFQRCGRPRYGAGGARRRGRDCSVCWPPTSSSQANSANSSGYCWASARRCWRCPSARRSASALGGLLVTSQKRCNGLG